MDAGEVDAMSSSTTLVVSFRGNKIELPLTHGALVGDIKSRLVASIDGSVEMTQADVKLMHKGKVLEDDTVDIYNLLLNGLNNPPRTIRLIATGISATEALVQNALFEAGKNSVPRVRDDLSEKGRLELAARQRLGQKVLAKVAAKDGRGKHKYGFGKIETLPMLPQEAKVKDILNSLANDPGILSCMSKHQWNVGCLAEMYPEGKVGQSEVCVMGLNQNKGQKILLRVRTDDLKGFRKILSIRKVLFHELAHNVYSEHDGDFFKLMRQVEKECNEMNWTLGPGQTLTDSSSGLTSSRAMEGNGPLDQPFIGGTYRLGGDSMTVQSHRPPARVMAGRAAMERMTAEEQEIEEACGCGRGGSYSHQPLGSDADDKKK